MSQKKTVLSPPDESRYDHLRDLPFAKDSDELALADIYLSKQRQAPLPLVIFIHGRPSARDTGQARSFGALATSYGLAGMTMDHRLGGFDSLQRTVGHIQSAVTYARKNAEGLNVDKGQVCLWFFSSGTLFLAPFLEQRPKWLQCIVIYYGSIGTTLWDTRGIEIPAEQRKGLNPLPYLKQKSDWKPKMLVVIAANDSKPLNSALENFVEQAKDNQWNVNLLVHENGQHAFDILDDNDRSRELIRASFEFVQASTND